MFDTLQKSSILIGLSIVLAVYLGLVLLVAAFQRKLIYFPVKPSAIAPGMTIQFEERGLGGWLVNPGKEKAILYFGGNAEAIEDNIPWFQSFSDYSVYLICYRGYGLSQGSPSEQGLCQDALYLYDELIKKHSGLVIMGRSLGSGVASFLAENRPIEKLVLVTPFDSLLAVAQAHYPIFPVKWFLKDPFLSIQRAPGIRVPTLILIAGQDQIVPPQHSYRLAEALPRKPQLVVIDRAGHNDIHLSGTYSESIKRFLVSD